LSPLFGVCRLSSSPHTDPRPQARERQIPTAMVVEDEAIIAMSLEDGLSDNGFEVVGPFSTCADALAALKIATPDVAILDAVLSDGPCLELARELRKRGVPFMIYSGADDFGEHAPELDGVPWLEKPSSLDSVLAAALGLLGR
jgi:DNA-binding response OmpR family regulator